MLFVDFSSAVNTIIPHYVVQKIGDLGRGSSLCSWKLGLPQEQTPECWDGTPYIIHSSHKHGHTTAMCVQPRDEVCPRYLLISSYQSALERLLTNYCTMWFFSCTTQKQEEPAVERDLQWRLQKKASSFIRDHIDITCSLQF